MSAICLGVRTLESSAQAGLDLGGELRVPDGGGFFRENEEDEAPAAGSRELPPFSDPPSHPCFVGGVFENIVHVWIAVSLGGGS